jgi:tetratricopeptide (TPR) repeat protein
LSASGEKVTDYSSSRESGWRDAGDESIDETIEQNLAAGRKGAAARIAWDAGRFEQALAWFREIELHYQAGACLRSLGRHREALEELLLTPSDGAHYRKACLEIVPAARALETLEFDVDRYLARFVDEGPKQPDEIDVFMQLAQLYRARDFAQGARRCCAKILALDPQHAEALAMRAQIDERAARPAHDSSTPPGELPSLPTLEEYVRLARANAPPRPGD